MMNNRIAFTPFRGIDASSATSVGVSARFDA
jgi:hypothetical protein